MGSYPSPPGFKEVEVHPLVPQLHTLQPSRVDLLQNWVIYFGSKFVFLSGVVFVIFQSLLSMCGITRLGHLEVKIM